MVTPSHDDTLLNWGRAGGGATRARPTASREFSCVARDHTRQPSLRRAAFYSDYSALSGTLFRLVHFRGRVLPRVGRRVRAVLLGTLLSSFAPVAASIALTRDHGTLGPLRLPVSE